jgi:hypothetical protein
MYGSVDWASVNRNQVLAFGDINAGVTERATSTFFEDFSSVDLLEPNRVTGRFEIDSKLTNV